MKIGGVNLCFPPVIVGDAVQVVASGPTKGGLYMRSLAFDRAILEWPWTSLFAPKFDGKHAFAETGNMFGIFFSEDIWRQYPQTQRSPSRRNTPSAQTAGNRFPVASE